jgi:EAL domain-containing protein (putative c-di-GMP-specific phosphodiesterase class I)
MFQPIVNIESMRTRSFEALIRWAHPERGLISPVEFIEHAEETGLIIRIGDWILNESCRLLASWRSAKIVPDDFSVGVNISKRQLVSPDLVGRVTQALTTHGLPGHCLSLEVTESSIVTCPVHLRQVLIQLKDLGVSIHMDDFGTGYSSLSQLHRLPVDVLKVDQEFVGTLNHTDETARIIPTIVILAHHLDMKVTVEGVENAAQLQRLVELQCDNVQGFHFSPPVSAEEAPKLILRDWSKIAGIATPSRVKRPAKAAGKTPPKGASGPRRAA